MVFTGLYPVESEDCEDLKVALEKLELNDSSFTHEPETSVALGFGFRCGFLGFLHAEIVQERLEREYDLNLITTAPTVRYLVVPKDGEPFEIESPAALPETTEIEEIQEPVVLATIHVPSDHLGAVLGGPPSGLQGCVDVHTGRLLGRGGQTRSSGLSGATGVASPTFLAQSSKAVRSRTATGSTSPPA